MNLHQRAVELVREYQRVEAELIEILKQIDDRKIYQKFGASSLFIYATKVLGLTESVAWNFISVARATKKHAALNKAIQNGELSVSKARRITSVLTLQNQDEWIEKAKTLSQRKLEKAVAEVNPKAATQDKASYITGDFMKLEFGLSETELEEIKYVQDLVCQSKQEAVPMKDAIMEAVRLYKHHKDPLEKVKRAKSIPTKSVRPSQTKPDSSQVSVERKASKTTYPAELIHALNQRDQNQCTGKNPDGTRCENKRWLDFHHVIPRFKGGKDILENMTTLCRAHHQICHKDEPQ
jgi:hypothetical protein